MIKNGLMVAGALVLGFVGSSWWSARAARRTEADRPAPVAALAHAAAPPLDLAELRAMIREEVRLARPGGGTAEAAGPAGATSAEARAERPRTPEQVTAQAEATTLVEDGLATGRWRAEDERRWVELRDDFPKADALALRLKLFQALNEGRVAEDLDVRPGGRAPASEATP
jgi:hypothetical protein